MRWAVARKTVVAAERGDIFSDIFGIFGEQVYVTEQQESHTRQ